MYHSQSATNSNWVVQIIYTTKFAVITISFSCTKNTRLSLPVPMVLQHKYSQVNGKVKLLEV